MVQIDRNKRISIMKMSNLVMLNRVSYSSRTLSSFEIKIFIIKKREFNFLIMYQDLLVFHVACSKVLYENMGSVLFLCIYQSPSKKVLWWAPLMKQKLRFERLCQL